MATKLYHAAAIKLEVLAGRDVPNATKLSGASFTTQFTRHNSNSAFSDDLESESQGDAELAPPKPFSFDKTTKRMPPSKSMLKDILDSEDASCTEDCFGSVLPAVRTTDKLGSRLFHNFSIGLDVLSSARESGGGSYTCKVSARAAEFELFLDGFESTS